MNDEINRESCNEDLKLHDDANHKGKADAKIKQHFCAKDAAYKKCRNDVNKTNK